jgi:hypothetical protein
MDYGKGLETYDSYYVSPPWTLGFMEEKDGMGVKTEPPSGYNILSSVFTFSSDNNPILKMKYDVPFWKLEGREWELFKKRVMAFSSKNPEAERLPVITYREMEDLKKRISGSWKDD